MTAAELVDLLSEERTMTTDAGIEMCTGPASTVEYDIIGVRIDEATNRVLIQTGECVRR